MDCQEKYLKIQICLRTCNDLPTFLKKTKWHNGAMLEEKLERLLEQLTVHCKRIEV